jgi:hypothetical protein
VEQCSITDNHLNCSSRDGIRFLTDTLIAKRENIYIANNFIGGYDGNGIQFASSPSSANATNSLIIKNNRFDSSNSISRAINLASGYFGPNIIIEDNPVIGTAFSVPKPATVGGHFFKTAPTIKWTMSEYKRNIIARPSVIGYSADGTLADGFTIYNNNILLNEGPAQGEAIGWTCSGAGTFGTLVGVTANADGTNVVTLIGNSTSGVGPGARVIINSTSAFVDHLSDDLVTATLSVNIPAIAGGAVAYVPPVMQEFGRISDTIVDATVAGAINTGDATTDNIIAAMRTALDTFGILRAA